MGLRKLALRDCHGCRDHQKRWVPLRRHQLHFERRSLQERPMPLRRLSSSRPVQPFWPTRIGGRSNLNTLAKWRRIGDEASARGVDRASSAATSVKLRYISVLLTASRVVLLRLTRAGSSDANRGSIRSNQPGSMRRMSLPHAEGPLDRYQGRSPWRRVRTSRDGLDEESRHGIQGWPIRKTGVECRLRAASRFGKENSCAWVDASSEGHQGRRCRSARRDIKADREGPARRWYSCRRVLSCSSPPGTRC